MTLKTDRVLLASVLLGSVGTLIATGCGKTASPNDWALCATNTDCTVASASCCAACGRPELEDVDGVNQARLDEHFKDVCPRPVPCPTCVEQKNPALVPTCDDQVCAVVDVRQQDVAACTSDADCRLRVTGCCECGGSTSSGDLIAINSSRESAYLAFVCDPEQACPECAPVYPTDVEAYCAPEGYCDVRLASDCTESDCQMQGLTCCGDRCVATYNDIHHCGTCDNACGTDVPYCDGTACATPPCDTTCVAAGTCCGTECCEVGQLCCTIPGPGPTATPSCVTPDATGTCPIGCPLCE